MKRAQLLVTLAVAPAVTLVCALVVPATAAADNPYDPYALAPVSAGHVVTWSTAPSSNDATSVTRDSPVTRARELLTRSRFLEDAANLDEKAATELAAKLVSLRVAAKTARERAESAKAPDAEALGARADDLEADVIVSEAEITFKRKTAADNRRIARQLRLRAVKLVREAPLALPGLVEEPSALACDPPFRFTPDGRKIYRIECLK